MRHYKGHIKTINTVTIVFDKGEPAVITKENDAYDQIQKYLSKNEMEKAAQVADISLNVEASTEGKFKLDKQTGTAVFNDETLPTALAGKLVKLVQQDKDVKALELFWANLKQNPREESRNDLFAFIEKNKIPITADGYFVAYKRVREDYKDHYTGKFDNRPGTVVKMDRTSVDQNNRNECSTGLHVAAWDYAANQYHSGEGKMLEVKVNPRDVVAVPPDYDGHKMRVCEYTVVGIATKGERESLTYSPVIPMLEPKSTSSSLILVLDGRGRLQISKQMLNAAGLNRSKKLAVRVDPRVPDKVRIAAFAGKGLSLAVTRLGIYVPAAILSAAGLQSAQTFKYDFRRNGITIWKE